VGLAGAEEAIVVRLEAAMITGRRWPADAFRTFVLGTGQADGLVGAVFGEGGSTTLFRILDGEAVDLDGTPVALAGTVGLPHPVELTEAQLRTWAGGPTPSFSQLERPFTRDARKASEALCAKGPVSAKTFVQRAEARGFQHGDPEDAGMIYSVRRRIGSWVLSIEHDGLTASGKRPVTGAKLKVRGPGFRSDDDRWDPPTQGLASEAHEDLLVLLA
jgi:hypothetical protein